MGKTCRNLGRSAQNLAREGVKTICYNFMPVLRLDPHGSDLSA